MGGITLPYMEGGSEILRPSPSPSSVKVNPAGNHRKSSGHGQGQAVWSGVERGRGERISEGLGI